MKMFLKIARVEQTINDIRKRLKGKILFGRLLKRWAQIESSQQIMLRHINVIIVEKKAIQLRHFLFFRATKM